MNPWTTGKRRAVFTSPGKGVGAGLGMPVSRSPVAAPLHSKQAECVLERIYLVQIYCCYFINKIRFSGVKI